MLECVVKFSTSVILDLRNGMKDKNAHHHKIEFLTLLPIILTLSISLFIKLIHRRFSSIENKFHHYIAHLQKYERIFFSYDSVVPIVAIKINSK